MFNLPNGKVTIGQILLPVALVALVMFLMLSFQFTQILRDRDNMHQAAAQQEKPLADVQKVQGQLNALAVGTQKLADAGDKGAKAIIARMKDMGILVNANGAPPSGAAPAAAPKAPAKVTR